MNGYYISNTPYKDLIMMKIRSWLPATLFLSAICLFAVQAFPAAKWEQTVPIDPSVEGKARQIPARTIPIPGTASPALQKAIGRPMVAADEAFRAIPKTTEEWRKSIAGMNEGALQGVTRLRKVFPVTVKNGTLNGVNTYTITPPHISPENRNRVLLHFHPGAYVYLGGESGIGEAILMAHYSRTKVVSVDYRMAPDHPFPAALNDAVTVWKKLARTYKPGRIGVFGTSAGGGLTLALVHKLKSLNLPLPGAIAAGTPWSDLTKTGDSYFTNEGIDGVIGTADGPLLACAKLYAGTEDPKNPLLSPVYGDFARFPPSIMTTGTRDLFLSNTVRVHRKLRQAGVHAELQVFEAMSHGEYSFMPDSPESKEAFTEIARFLATHLGR